MAWINVGAFINGERPRSKKQLKEIMLATPQNVKFDATSMMEVGRTIRGDELPVGDKLTVTGPDPYSNRKWYATVTDDGKVV